MTTEDRRIQLQKSIDLKTKATEWVDHFWEKLPKVRGPDQNMRSLFHHRAISDWSRADTITESNLSYDPNMFVRLCAGRHGVDLTEKALKYVALLATTPPRISMLMAAIVHSFRPEDHSKTNLIRYEWLHVLIGKNGFTDETEHALWQAQVQPDGSNLIDKYDAFRDLTSEESELLAEH